MKQESKDYLLLHFLVLIWGFTAILGLIIQLPPVELVFYRTLLASVGLLLIIYARKRSLALFHRGDLWKVVAVGVMIAAHWILFFLAARVSNASVCLAGMATCSLWTSLVEPFYLKKRIRKFEVFLSILAFAGMLVIFKVEFEYVLGLSLALLSAFFAALFTVVNAKLTQQNDHFVITFYEMAFASLSTVLFFPFYMYFFTDGQLNLSPSFSDWVGLLILAGVCTVFAYSYSIKLMRRLSAFAVNLTVNLEPVYGIILALLIFGEKEKMSPGFYLGTSFIMLSVLVYPLINRRLRRKALETDVLR
ncbi:MAG: DMT family transporter [Cyclobacteriaceae bacterium]|nr:DMT family transporter [Cyclobacteriaceae bacterium]